MMVRSQMESIFLIDDDLFMLNLLERMLETVDQFDVHKISDPATAFSAFKEHLIPDLVILDINMPHIDGIEFIRYLAENEYPGCLVLLTGEDRFMLETTARLARLHELNVIAALQKPLTALQLRELLERCSQFQQRVADTRMIRIYQPEQIVQGLSKGQIIPYYQPKVSLKDGSVIGFESLARWEHPEDGVVPPASFIPVAEQSDLIHHLSKALFIIVVDHLASLLHDYPQLKVSFNVTMKDLDDLVFADFLNDILRIKKINPNALIFEITETGVMENLVNQLDVIARMRLKKYSFSIDDFGTGHSSLAKLIDLPIDELKIDYTFTHDAWRDERRSVLFQASSLVGHRLGLTVVAEGIENVHDWSYAVNNGCDIGQGFFIARPMPIQDVPSWMNGWEHRVKTERLVQR